MIKQTFFSQKNFSEEPWGNPVSKILAASLEAVNPARAIHDHVKRQDNQLLISGTSYDLNDYGRVFLVGIGKACLPMAWAVTEIMKDNIVEGILIPKASPNLSIPSFPPHIHVYPAAHPVPDMRSTAAAQKIITLLNSTQSNDLVFVLVSGGGSALLTAPVQEVTLEDLRELNRTLLASGVSIEEINAIRKHLSQLKGGRLAKQASHASLITLILSDVIGNPLDAIASGPTVPDPTTYQESLKIIHHHHIQELLPPSILTHLEKGATGKIPETPKPNDPAFKNNPTHIIGDNRQAALGGLKKAQQEGFHSQVLTTSLQGEAKEVGKRLASLLKQMAQTGKPLPTPACIIAGGETTVTLGQSPGLGGRNLEVALGAVEEISRLPNIALITLATDGEDGPTDAAGAVVTGQTLYRAKSKNLSPQLYLNQHDAYHFFEPLGNLLKTGPTGTNVNDLTFLFTF